MRKQKFLDNLRDGLYGPSAAEIEEILSFFSEMIDDRVEDGLTEDEAVAEFGDVESILQRLNADSTPARSVYKVEARRQYYDTVKHEVTADFDSVIVCEPVADIELLPADDNICKVICCEWEKLKYSVRVSDGTLIIERSGMSKWLDHVGNFLGQMRISVFLPKRAYASLTVETEAGDVRLQDLTAKNIDLKTDTGNIQLSDVSAEYLWIGSDSGDIHLENIAADEKLSVESDAGNAELSCCKAAEISVQTDAGDIHLENIAADEKLSVESDAGSADLSCCKAAEISVQTDAGDIHLENIAADKKLFVESDAGNAELSCCKAAEISVQTDTGDIGLTDVTSEHLLMTSDTGDVSLQSVIADKRLSIENDTGDVELRGCDAADIYIETDTGDITGELLSEMVFIVRTDAGRVEVPKTVSGGRCELITDTGDIEISIRK